MDGRVLELTDCVVRISKHGFAYGLGKGGSLKRSLRMAFSLPTIPKAYGFEAATQS